ncbi:MAG: molybdate ABC transporter substrate-binding protein [Candidatus Omnitrophota bacterium]
MKKIILMPLFVLLLPCRVFAGESIVAVAANLTPVMNELKSAFEKESRGKLNIVTGSSGKLTEQIKNGAPFDVFLSADTEYPEILYQEGLTIDSPKVYVYGVLVLWTTRINDLSDGIAVLNEPVIKKIALADPRVAPYGREAVNVLKYYKLYQGVNKKLVYGESIPQVNDFIVSGSADIGFTSKSTVFTPNLREKGDWVEIPAESYGRIAQAVVILKHARDSDIQTAKRFYNFLFSPRAKDIFKKYGYTADE